jgi:excisionase family DNA binding protein
VLAPETCRTLLADTRSVANVVHASPLVPVREVADRFAVSEKTVRRLIERGELPALKVGGQVRVDPIELAGWTGVRDGLQAFGHVFKDVEANAKTASASPATTYGTPSRASTSAPPRGSKTPRRPFGAMYAMRWPSVIRNSLCPALCS